MSPKETRSIRITHRCGTSLKFHIREAHSDARACLRNRNHSVKQQKERKRKCKKENCRERERERGRESKNEIRDTRDDIKRGIKQERRSAGYQRKKGDEVKDEDG